MAIYFDKAPQELDVILNLHVFPVYLAVNVNHSKLTFPLLTKNQHQNIDMQINDHSISHKNFV